MIDFKVTFKADEIFYGDYKNDKSDFKNHVKKISTTI